jgi:hypothetical protein
MANASKSLQGFTWKDYASTTTADTFNAIRFQLGAEVGKNVTKTTFRGGKIYKTPRVKVMLIDGIVHHPEDDNTSALISAITDSLELVFQLTTEEKTAIVLPSNKDEIHTFYWRNEADGTEAVNVYTGYHFSGGNGLGLKDIPVDCCPIFDPDVWVGIYTQNAGQLVNWHFKIFYHFEHWTPNKVTKWGKQMA